MVSFEMWESEELRERRKWGSMAVGEGRKGEER